MITRQVKEFSTQGHQPTTRWAVLLFPILQDAGNKYCYIIPNKYCYIIPNINKFLNGNAEYY
jgi:hypothetical protein